MINKEYDDEQAVIALSNEIGEIQDKLDKAMILIQEITEEYFLKYDKDSQKDRESIAWEYSRYRIYSEMIFNYVWGAKEKIDKLKQIETDAYEMEISNTYINDSDKSIEETDISELLQGLSQKNIKWLLAFKKGLLNNQNVD